MAALEGESGRVKVPIDRVAAAAYRVVFGRPGRVLEVAWLPMLVLLAVELLPRLISDYFWPDDTAAAASLPGADIAETVIVMLCLSAFAVRWHHLVLAADRPLPLRRFLAVWARFLGYSLPFYLVMLAVAAGAPVALHALSAAITDHPIAGLSELFTENTADALVAVIALAISLVVARCSLVFPAVVIGQPLGLAGAWRHMRGNTWRFLAATLLVTTPILLLVWLLLDLILEGAHLPLPDPLAPPPTELFLLNGVLTIVLLFIFTALGATVLADFYRRLVLHVRSN
ncbi:MAG TPA: hypothetical protein VGP50_11200 [Stellaceae bacterium]|nr:hypothetical protein [Stellaceae bacterium]